MELRERVHSCTDNGRSARGNTSLESAVSLTKSLRGEIQDLGVRISRAVWKEDAGPPSRSRFRNKNENESELRSIVQRTRALLDRIEDAVPLINLAITTSGASLSTTLPTTISPSRLLQASTFLTAGDSQYCVTTTGGVQIGPTFTLSVYMLFSGHIRPETEEEIRQSTWKEVIHKAKFKLLRVPLEALGELPGSQSAKTVEESTHDWMQLLGTRGLMHTPNEFAYQMVIVEDLEDDRVHTFEDDATSPGAFEGVRQAGIREIIPVHEISKIFYADTGKILNIGNSGEANYPVLLLKRDLNAVPPSSIRDDWDERGLHHENDPVEEVAFSIPRPNGSDVLTDTQSRAKKSLGGKLESPTMTGMASKSPRGFPSNLDPEWLAFEVYKESEGSESDSESVVSSDQSEIEQKNGTESAVSMVKAEASQFDLDENFSASKGRVLHVEHQIDPERQPPSVAAIHTSLSLLETLLRLLSLQQFQQTSHLAIPDELLNFFLSETATTGAAHGDGQERRRLRNEARRRVGFDPYDESPIKQRGEEYQSHSWEGPIGGKDANYMSPHRSGGERNGFGTPDRQTGFDDRSLPSGPLSITSEPGNPVTFRHLEQSTSQFKQSPLARSITLNTDEGLGTSPSITPETSR